MMKTSWLLIYPRPQRVNPTVRAGEYIVTAQLATFDVTDCSAGDVEQTDDSTLRFIPGLDRLARGQQLHLTLSSRKVFDRLG